MTAIEWIVPIGFASLGAGLGYVLAVLRYSEPAIDVAMLEADLARWKARGAKEQMRADRLEEKNYDLRTRIEAAMLELQGNVAFDPPEAG